MCGKMKCVYVAGAYSANAVAPDVLSNMRRGFKLAIEVVRLGASPYVPWSDCLLHFQEAFDLETCYAYSMAWLEKADAVIVVPEGAEDSKGTRAEIARAKELGLPVFLGDAAGLAFFAVWLRYGSQSNAELAA